MKTLIHLFPVIGILILSSLLKILVAQNTAICTDTDTIRQQNLSEVVITANRYSSNRFNTPEAIELLRRTNKVKMMFTNCYKDVFLPLCAHLSGIKNNQKVIQLLSFNAVYKTQLNKIETINILLNY